MGRWIQLRDLEVSSRFSSVGSGLDESAAGSLWCSFCFILIRLALLLARVGVTRVKSGSEFSSVVREGGPINGLRVHRALCNPTTSYFSVDDA